MERNREKRRWPDRSPRTAVPVAANGWYEKVVWIRSVNDSRNKNETWMNLSIFKDIIFLTLFLSMLSLIYRKVGWQLHGECW